MDATTKTQTTPEQKRRFVNYKIRDTFNLPEAAEAAVIPGFAEGLPGVPQIDPLYVFEMDRLRQFTMFWVGGFRALMIEGDPSAGKTSFIAQIHARLNVPLHKVPCTPKTDSYQLVGQMLPTEDGRLHWVDGPVVRACRDGTSVMLDEYNVLDPGEATGLNMLLEGYSWTIPETGEVITPAPSTRFFVTQNAVDSMIHVAGRNEQDTANDDRFSYMQVDFLSADLEKDLIVRHLVAGGVEAEKAKPIAHICVEVATEVRKAFREGADPNIDKPISTRAALRWAKYTVMYNPILRSKGRSGLHFAIQQALRMRAPMAGAVNQQITLKAGYDENLVTATT